LQWGKKDIRVTKAETEEIFQNLPLRKKELVIYNNSGHESLASNEPQKWNSTVRTFLESK
jgi:esterase/lipase